MTIIEIINMPFVWVLLTALAAVLIHMLDKRIDRPWVLGVTKDIVAAIRDSNTKATWSMYFDLFYKAIKAAKHRDPTDSEWDTAIKIFKEELLEDELKKLPEADNSS